MKKIILVLIFTLFIGLQNVSAENLRVSLSSCLDENSFQVIVNDNIVTYNIASLKVDLEAKDYICQKLTNASSIILETEDNQNLAWVWLDENLLQKDLVEQNLAEVINDNYQKYTNSLCLYEQNMGSYCQIVDYANTIDNIIYEDDSQIDENKSEDEEKINGFVDSLEEGSKKIENFTSQNEDTITNVLLYVFIIGAIITMLYQEFKK